MEVPQLVSSTGPFKVCVTLSKRGEGEVLPPWWWSGGPYFSEVRMTLYQKEEPVVTECKNGGGSVHQDVGVSGLDENETTQTSRDQD